MMFVTKQATYGLESVVSVENSCQSMNSTRMAKGLVASPDIEETVRNAIMRQMLEERKPTEIESGKNASECLKLK